MVELSVVVPVYNVKKYLERCIQSILRQEYQDYEIILVDDGSTDESGIMCDNYASKYDCVTVIHKKNEGLGYARNTGIDHAAGKYVTFIDSDDYVEKDFFKELVDNARCKKADTVIAGYSRNQNGKITEINNPIKGCTYSGNEIKTNVLVKMLGPNEDASDVLNMAAWRVLYSMDIIKKNNLRFPSEREFISEDIIFNIRYYQFANFVSGVSNCGYIYCMNPGSLTERYNQERYKKGETLYIEKKRLLELGKLYTNEAKFRTEEAFLRYTRYAIKSEVKFSKINGKKKTLDNILSIVKEPVYLDMLKAHDNKMKTKVDSLIDYFAVRKSVNFIYWFLKLGYLVRKQA